MAVGFNCKPESSSRSSGMGFLFVFVPDEENNCSFRPFHSLLKCSNSSHLLHKAHSTISIFTLLFFFFTILLLITHSTLPSIPTGPHLFPRMKLSTTHKLSSASLSSIPPISHALQGMGRLYRRGTTSMNELVVAHAVESLTPLELKLFLGGLFYHSSLSSRSDLVLVFPAKSVTAFDNTIVEENDSFLKLVREYGKLNHTTQFPSSFDATQFIKHGKEKNGTREPMWGRSIPSQEEETELTRLRYGSVVGFEVEELDPDNSLSGFLDHNPMSLRRWACYPMLLGRVKRNFKHIMLVDIKEILLINDPLARVRNQSPESVYLTTLTQSVTSRHGRRTQSSHQKLANPAIIMGGAKGTRRLSNAMLTQIVRSAMQHKKKNSLAELGLFNQLVSSEFLLKNVNLIMATALIPEMSSLTGLNFKRGSSLSINHTLIRRGNTNNKDTNYVVMKLLCLSSLDC